MCDPYSMFHYPGSMLVCDPYSIFHYPGVACWCVILTLLHVQKTDCLGEIDLSLVSFSIMLYKYLC